MARTNVKIYFDGKLCVILALMLLLLPLKWVAAMIAAALIHELSHGLAVSFFGGRIYAIGLGVHGIRMETDALPPGRELIAALAGPIGSAALILLTRYFPRTAVCGAVHCIYNLVPLFPLDGGRVLKNLLVVCAPNDDTGRLFRRLQSFVRGALAVFCVFAGVRFGLLPALAALFILLRQRKKENLA